MNALQLIPSHLGTALAGSGSARAKVAQMAAWLHPLLNSRFDMYDYEDDPDLACLHIASEAGSSVYARLLQATRQTPEPDIPNLLSHLLGESFPHLHLTGYDFEFGVPLNFYGIRWSELDEADYHVIDLYQCVPYLEMFGITIDENGTLRPDPYDRSPIAHILANSLLAVDGQPHINIACFLMWLFSVSGNTLIDLDINDFYEYGYDNYSWRKEDLLLADEMQEEADLIVEAAMHGLETLQGSRSLRSAMQKNIQVLLRHTEEERRSSDVTSQFHWPEPRKPAGINAERKAFDRSVLLYFRHLDDQEQR